MFTNSRSCWAFKIVSLLSVSLSLSLTSDSFTKFSFSFLWYWIWDSNSAFRFWISSIFCLNCCSDFKSISDSLSSNFCLFSFAFSVKLLTSCPFFINSFESWSTFIWNSWISVFLSLKFSLLFSFDSLNSSTSCLHFSDNCINSSISVLRLFSVNCFSSTFNFNNATSFSYSVNLVFISWLCSSNTRLKLSTSSFFSFTCSSDFKTISEISVLASWSLFFNASFKSLIDFSLLLKSSEHLNNWLRSSFIFKSFSLFTCSLFCSFKTIDFSHSSSFVLYCSIISLDSLICCLKVFSSIWLCSILAFNDSISVSFSSIVVLFDIILSSCFLFSWSWIS